MILRTLKTHADYLAAEDLQRSVWGFPDREVIPLNELVVAQRNGGLVFGAFERGKMMAFCFGCVGRRGRKVYHYSRMLGVLPGRQDQGLGLRMKEFQREFILRAGLDSAKWTFDPLQGRNARFNIEKLGCTAGEYLVNYYGASGSAYNAGLETDRLVVEWRVKSGRVRDALSGRRREVPLREARARWTPVIEGSRTRLTLRDPAVSIEIPGDIEALKSENLEQAREWRARTRKSFLTYFRKGYRVTGFTTGEEGGVRRNLYRLEKGS